MAATLLKSAKLGLLLALFFAASSWFYIQHIIIPHQIAEAAVHDHPRGNLSDLYPRWLGARELFLHHRDPYSLEVTREIQAGYYGRVLDPMRPGDPKDQQAFAYPVYVVFLLEPTIHFPFASVQHVFYWLLWFITGGSVLLWLRAQRWKPANSTIAILMMMTLGADPGALGRHMRIPSTMEDGVQTTTRAMGAAVAATAALPSGAKAASTASR